ncbi:MAG: hypothetical protein K8T89_25805 [Planctomycetes bacterium]|nr:hypothetical protein [Planctomycetota bacterium]
MSAQNVNAIVKLFKQVPPKYLIPFVFLGVAGLLGLYFLDKSKTPKTPQPTPPAAAGTNEVGSYLLCSWNVENFFDDEDDPKNDDSMEDWFARNPDKFRLKVEHLADALLMMNDGHGPDIMALTEVESAKCLNVLKDVLNGRLQKAGKTDQKYEHVLFLGDKLGRRFAPGIVTRLPVIADRTRKVSSYAGNGRMIEGHLKVQDRELIILAAHWTSRVDSGGAKPGEAHANADRRMSYAMDCFGRYKAIVTANPTADVVICGDLNDEFQDSSIQDGLHATSWVEATQNSVEPRPFALFANWSAPNDPPGSIYGKGRWSVFDHILVSKGLLDDQGWSCDVSSASIFAPPQMRASTKKSKGEPFRFGDHRDLERGYSDHFPVTVRLRVK